MGDDVKPPKREEPEQTAVRARVGNRIDRNLCRRQFVAGGKVPLRQRIDHVVHTELNDDGVGMEPRGRAVTASYLAAAAGMIFSSRGLPRR